MWLIWRKKTNGKWQRRSKEKLLVFAVKFDVDSNKGKKGVVHTRKHMRVAESKDLEDAVYKWYVQEHSVVVNVRGVDILDATVKLDAHMGIHYSGSAGWLWRFCNCHGIHNKVVHGEAGSGDSGVVEPFRLKFQKLIKEEDLSLSQIYNADETCLFWCLLPTNIQAFKNEDKIPGKKFIKDKFSALPGANASSTHRLKSVVVWKAARPRCLEDCMHELPVVYQTCKTCGSMLRFSVIGFLIISFPKCVIIRRKCYTLLLRM